MKTHARKTKAHSTRKQCQTCKQFGWYRPRERKCKRARYEGSSLGYLCWGPLTAAPIVRRTPTTSSDDGAALSADAHDRAQRGAAHRRTAERRLDAIRGRIGDTTQRIDDARRSMDRLRRLLARQQRDERKWSAEAVLTDEQLSARRERARHAAQVRAKVQRVRTRLSASASMFDDDAANKLRLKLARKRVHAVLLRRARTRRRVARRARP